MRFPAGLLLSLVALSTNAPALDLTPIENWREQEGVRISTLTFNDTYGKVRYQPPGNWRVSGDATTLSLYPAQQEAFMQLRLFPRRNEPGAVEDLPKWSRMFLPPDAADIVAGEERPSPFTLSGRPSREFIYSYRSGGKKFQTGVAICDLDERERLVVIITARAADFQDVHDTGISSLFSWSQRR